MGMLGYASDDVARQFASDEAAKYTVPGQRIRQGKATHHMSAANLIGSVTTKHNES